MLRPIRSRCAPMPTLLLGLVLMGAGTTPALAVSSGISRGEASCADCTDSTATGSIGVTILPMTSAHLAAIAIHTPAVSDRDAQEMVADVDLLAIFDGKTNPSDDAILRPSALLKAHAEHRGSRAYSFYRWPRRRSATPPPPASLE